MTYYPMGAVAAPQYVPMGWFGDAVARSAPVIGGTVGGITSALTKNPALGGFVGGVTNMVARDYGHLIPFQAGPQMMQAPAGYAPQGYAPQGMWGNLISGAGNLVGGIVGGNTGRVIRDASGLAQYLPFEAGPQMAQAPMYQAPVYQQQAFAPQGAFGNFVRDVAPVVGQHVGGNWGRVISTVGSLGDLLPFEAGPQMMQPQAYAPQGFFGGLGGSILGGAIGGAFGNRNLGSAIGGIAGSFLPFQAGPMANGYAQGDAIVYH